MAETVLFANRHSTPKRVLLACAGVGVIAWPLTDLWPGLATWSVAAPIFWIIALGATGIGGILIAGALFGTSTILIAGPEGLTLVHEAPLRRRTARLDAHRIGPVAVVAQHWSEGPVTYRVKIAPKECKPLLSDDFQTRAAAEDLAEGLRQALARLSA